jgi:hypothetical protein
MAATLAPADPAGKERAVRPSYNKSIAPVFQKHCVICHRQGEVAPFTLTHYEDAVNWADMIQEVIEQGRMPPWHANPKYGRFANDPHLSPQEKQLILDWIRGGLAQGDPADLPEPRKFPSHWAIGEPDLILQIPTPIVIPARGVLEYQNVDVDSEFLEDKWVQAVEIRPGNRAVVHHCNVFLKPPGGEGAVEGGSLGSYCLAAMAPGTPPLVLPRGMAKLIPAGWHLLFVIHYTPTGTVQTDQTSIGLRFAEAGSVKKEVATKLLYDPDLSIPPGSANFLVEKSYRFPEDSLLLAMFPHMHLRGKSFRYQAFYPNGSAEILLDVPNYNFAWQNRYELAEPKFMPQGTVLRCTAHYDNSKSNPANPDPSAQVRAGPQSWDEMFNGYFEFALAGQDLAQPNPRTAFQKVSRFLFRGPALLAWSALAGLILFRKVYQRKRQRTTDSTSSLWT